ncbi:MAG: metalloregulator ArsR/SmtB family transcription factor [Candidatus Diapherotrites archaeon]|uniref:Metalloregulator ArsR/SmtB family transcription factor n=1 Tax=Candidatus Iainarchaeum sp. TaxID=3101447 RepID=A0A938YNI1_9ARCH|nr:metalloregulator ArsR/SmtB family transcription factor [Candidatus Diapherotrites archaeon]
MEKSIEISSNEFKALASETRTEMIKLLRERNHTLTELSQKLNMAAPTIKQHLEILQQAGLIEGLDEGRKWKYYTLTRKGKNIVGGEAPTNVLIVLAVSSVAMLVLLYGFVSMLGVQSPAGIFETGAEMRYMDSGQEYDWVPTIAEAPETAKSADGIVSSISGAAADQNGLEAVGETAGNSQNAPAIAGQVDQNSPAIAGRENAGSDQNSLAITNVERQPSGQQCPSLICEAAPLMQVTAMLGAIVITAILIGFMFGKGKKGIL